MHVLILPSWYPMHYAPTRGIFFQEQAQALRQHGVRVGVIYPNFRSLRTIGPGQEVFRDHFQTTLQDDKGVPTYRFHGWNPGHARLRGLAFRRHARRLMKKYIAQYGRPDLIHAHSVLWGGVAARDISQEYSIPYVITEHSTAFARELIRDWQRPHIRKAFEGAEVVWAVSSAFKQKLEPFAGDAEIEVMPNMVDTDFFTLPPHPRTASPFTFLTVALLTPKKGIDVLLRGFACAFQNRNDVKLEIGGDGEQRQVLERLARELKISGQVQFLGMLSREEVREAMWRANAFVLPSFVETFGVVLIEAMATGLPVVATRSGGPEDFVKDEVGLLVTSGDDYILSSALESIINSKYDNCKSKIRNYITNNFDVSVIIRSIAEGYKNILEDE